MSQLKYCQGPKCHTYDTKDRKKGPKDNKRNETRRRSSFYYLDGNCCSMQCMYDWFNVYGQRALQHFGMITQPRVLTQDNAWSKDYNWIDYRNDTREYFYVNGITKEQRPLTREQYHDSNYTLNTGE